MMDARTLTQSNADEIAEWCGGRRVVQHHALDDSVTFPSVNVPVGTSVERAQLGDVVIRNSDGTFRIDRQLFTK
jgi:polysaccharide deacetylase 2 family uncharacterized protein YibQ